MTGFDLAGSKTHAQLKRIGVVSGCAVAEQDPEAMAVDVEAGEVLFGFGQAPVAIAETSVEISEAHATLDRIDLVCVDADGHVTVVTGTPAETPPTPYPNGRIVLASVEVEAEVEDIQTAAITDERVILALGGVPDASGATEGDVLTVDDADGYGWDELPA